MRSIRRAFAMPSYSGQKVAKQNRYEATVRRCTKLLSVETSPLHIPTDTVLMCPDRQLRRAFKPHQCDVTSAHSNDVSQVENSRAPPSSSPLKSPNNNQTTSIKTTYTTPTPPTPIRIHSPCLATETDPQTTPSTPARSPWSTALALRPMYVPAHLLRPRTYPPRNIC